jgi:acid phosphatase type 7
LCCTIICALLGCVAAAIPAKPASANAPDRNPTLVFPQFVTGQPIRLVAYGDTRFTDPAVTSGTNPRVRKWLADRIADEHPDALLLTGDTPFTGSSTADWQVFETETARWREKRILQLPATGNHEVRGDRDVGIANYLANFPAVANHRYYSALLGSVEVISMDMTLPTAASSPQGKWFAAQLNNVPHQIEFLFILFHIPWVADRQSQIFVGIPNPESIALRDILEARLARIRAKVVVFNGHIHNYERFERRGVEYVITGGGGAEPYPLLFRGHADLYQDTGFPVYHYLTLEVSNHEVHAVMWKVKDPDAGTLSVEQKDEFTIRAAKPAKAETVRPQ